MGIDAAIGDGPGKKKDGPRQSKFLPAHASNQHVEQNAHNEILKIRDSTKSIESCFHRNSTSGNFVTRLTDRNFRLHSTMATTTRPKMETLATYRRYPSPIISSSCLLYAFYGC